MAVIAEGIAGLPTQGNENRFLLRQVGNRQTLCCVLALNCRKDFTIHYLHKIFENFPTAADTEAATHREQIGDMTDHAKSKRNVSMRVCSTGKKMSWLGFGKAPIQRMKEIP